MKNDVKKLYQKENSKNHLKTIFLNYLKFYNVKQKMNLEKVNCLSRKASFDFYLMNGCFI